MHVDVLAFAAHPDDIELACSGLILKLISQGYSAGIIDLTKGELGSRGNSEIRAKEADESAKILGINFRNNLGLEDGNIIVNKENQFLVIECIRKYRPKIILAPYWEDRHPDHVNASLLVDKSFFLSGLTKIVSEHDAYRPKNVIYYFQHHVSEPSFIVDISEQFDEKIKAIRAFKSQFYLEGSKEPQTHISTPEFFESIETKARYFGYRIGAKYAEPFLVKSAIKVNNIIEMFS